MFQMQFNNPRMSRWQTRLSRVPRWAWIAFFLGAVIPITVVTVILLATSLFTGFVVMVAVLAISTAINYVRRRLFRRPERRPSMQIVVRSVRVVDP